MPKRASAPNLAAVQLDRTAGSSLYRQLYDGLREAILDGQLPAGTRLPSTRTLADDLGVSRNTVMNAFDQLLAEGYLEARVGAGTYVTSTLPDDLLRARVVGEDVSEAHQPRDVLSRRGQRLASARIGVSRDEGPPRAFSAGVPALDAFPFNVWGRLAARAWRNPPPEHLGYGQAAGYLPLRRAIADYLRVTRGVRCQAEQVVMVTGAQQALDLAARLLLDAGDQVWLEDPGYLAARSILLSAGAELAPVPVDEQGLDLVAGIARAPGARLAYISPSHQYPLGVTMSLARRLQLLEWANRAGMWILEDDYDSEYRYSSQPLAALQGLDVGDRVIYVGTFSKVIFPSLRLGYLIVPPDLVDAFATGRGLVDRHPPIVPQAILAAFIEEGHFLRHIRRMRALYQERQAILIDEIRRELGGYLEIVPAEAGMHLVGWLPEGVGDKAVFAQLRVAGVEAPPLSLYSIEPLPRAGLVLGYAAFDAATIRRGVRQMAVALGL